MSGSVVTVTLHAVIDMSFTVPGFAADGACLHPRNNPSSPPPPPRTFRFFFFLSWTVAVLSDLLRTFRCVRHPLT